MQETAMKSISALSTRALVTVSFAGMAVFAVIDQAEARKGITASGSGTYKVGPIAAGGVKKLPTTGTTGTAKPSSPVGHGLRPCTRPYQRVCIRTPPKHIPRPPGRVVPKEDPPQKW
jgi:hypothetical protein